MRKKIVLLLTIVFALSLIFSLSINANANTVYATDTDDNIAIAEQEQTLADNEYSTLDEFKAAFAQALYNSQEKIVLRLRGAELSNADIAKIINEVISHDLDNPKGGDYILEHMKDIYSYNFASGEDENGVYTEFVFECTFRTNAQMEKEVDEAVAALLEELDLWEASDYRKIKGVYDWIADNITYDYDWDDGVAYNEHAHTAHAAIVDKTAVCQGIATLFYRLMLELDVDCRYINGESGGERHGWNIVKLNGMYYNVDATWDLGVSNYHRYFLCTNNNFHNHDRDTYYNSEEWNAQYPMATLPYVEHVAASGSVNSNIHWVLDADTGTLTVSGTGAIPSYRYSYAPWYNYRNNISRIVIEEGITEVGERAFYWSVNCGEVLLPSSLIAIREYGFNNLQNLESITLPENLKIIEFCAFSECTALKSIVLPDSVTTVGSSAFSNCKALTTAVLSAGMKEVPDSMFFGDIKLASIVLPEGITRIDDTVFSNCAFTEFAIPSTVTSIGVSAFSSCNKLTSITVDEKNATYKSVDGVLFSKDGTHLICYPAAKKGSQYAIPEGTVVIDYGAFRGQSKLFTVSFPSTLVEIEGYAFSYCPYLDSLVFPKTLTTIGSDAFRSCRYLSSVTFENPDVNLVGYTFADCTSLEKITLPSNLKEIPSGLFFGCRALKNIDIPKTVTSIGSSAFFDCDSLIDVVIPGNVKFIGQQAFDFCKFLDSITFEEGVTTLEWIAIRNAPSLSTVVFPSSLKSIGKENFENCPYVRIYAACGSVGYNYAINNGISYTASHSYVPIAKYPSTCTKQGYTLYSCPCGKLDSYKDDYLPLLAHTYKAKVTAPTCTNQGYTTHTCSVCGTSYIDTYTDALGHSFGDWYEVISPDCTTKGSEQRDCSRCKHHETNVVNAIGHSYASVVTVPTCTEQGYTTHTCSTCGNSYVDSYVDALGHSEVVDSALIPTSSKSGLTEGKHCSTCGTIILPQETLPAKGYEWMLEDGEFKILLIGNSFSEDASNAGMPNSQMLDILQAMLGKNVKVTIGLCYSGGKGLNWHATQSEQGNKSYSLRVISTETEGWKSYGSYSSADALAWTNWDVVSLQHYEINTTTGKESNAYPDQVDPKFDSLKPATEFMLDYVNQYAPQTDVYFYMHWARAYNPNLNESLATYNKMADYMPVVLDYAGNNSGNRFETIIPVGLSVQNARTTYLALLVYNTTAYADKNLNLTTDAQIGLQRDGGHLSFNIGRYIAGLTFAETILPMELRAEEYVLPDIRITESVGRLPKEYTTIAQKSVWAALESWKNGSLEVTEIEGYKQDPTVAAGELLANTLLNIDCHRDADAISKAVLKLLSADFAVDKVVQNDETAEVTIRFGYTRFTVVVNYEVDEHSYNALVTTPTCTEQGYTTHTCHCGDTYIDTYVAPLGHNPGAAVVENRVEPTCTTSGSYDSVIYCVSCDIELSRTNIKAEALGHKFENYVFNNDATCTANGTETAKCERCDETDTKIDENLNLGHTPGKAVVENKIEPTCTNPGSYDNVTYCEVCDTELDREKITISALGHTPDKAVVENKIEPTCTKPGSYDNVTYCEVCNAELDREKITVSALGHTPGKAVVENKIEPTCTKPGSYDNVTYCEVCNAELDREKITVSALGHTPGKAVVENKVEPTCTNPGSYDNVTYCEVCNAELDREKITVSALGHTPGKAVVENKVEPTCTKPGSYDNVVYCELCNTELDREKITVSALGHTPGKAVVENKIEPTCTNPGSYDNVVYCKVCNAELNREKITVSALGHTPGKAVVENKIEPTCTNPGFYDNVIYCELCNAELDRETTAVKATGHNYGAWAQITAPGCETDGVERRDCAGCDKYETRNIPAHGHKWTEEEHYKVCESCGEMIELEKDHSECEASLFETIINIIVNFFRAIFGLPEKCVCGEELY